MDQPELRHKHINNSYLWHKKSLSLGISSILFSSAMSINFFSYSTQSTVTPVQMVYFQRLQLPSVIKSSNQRSTVLKGNWKTLKAGKTEMGTGNGNRTTPFFAYCFDDQVPSRRPPCGSPRLADKRY